MSRPTRRSGLVLLAFIAWIGTAALACGPFFPNQLLPDADFSALAPPQANFGHETQRLVATIKPRFAAVMPTTQESPQQQSIDADLADLATALTATRTAAPDRNRLLAQYRQARVDAEAIAQAAAHTDAAHAGVVRPAIAAGPIQTPAGLPAEFADYLRGVIAFDRQDYAAARSAWSDLLALPESSRKNKSVWAAFMLGKSYMSDNPAKAAEFFAMTRTLAAAGFVDRVGLAASSLGWEAQVDLRNDKFTDAIHLYAQQKAAGDSTATQSLRIACTRCLERPQSWPSLAADPLARDIITALLVSSSNVFGDGIGDSKTIALVHGWIDAVEKTGATNIDGADRLALAAYQVNDLVLARRWADRSAAGSPVAHWVKAKLLIHDGQIDKAAVEMAAAATAFPVDEVWAPADNEEGAAYGRTIALHPRQQVQGELGLLDLQRQQYADALRLFLQSNYWADAAYVAERVLTVDELADFVKRSNDLSPIDWFGNKRDLRYLLARRLARLDRSTEALPLFPADLAKTYKDYIANLATGRNKNATPDAQAAALWKAAQIARDDGLELFGTELGPDNFIVEGMFGAMAGAEDNQKEKPYRVGKLLAPTANEIARFVASALTIDKRFHYRYQAADLAWQAAALMPDESDQTAEVLCTAGTWLKARDPAAADRFYKALCARCGKTTLGQQAIALHWFPDLPTKKA